jgi:hypothetical protein
MKTYRSTLTDGTSATRKSKHDYTHAVWIRTTQQVIDAGGWPQRDIDEFRANGGVWRAQRWTSRHDLAARDATKWAALGYEVQIVTVEPVAIRTTAV